MKAESPGSSKSWFTCCSFLAIVVFISSIGTVSILQWKELLQLKERINVLEKNLVIKVAKRDLDDRRTLYTSSEDVATCCSNLAKPFIPLTSSTNIDVVRGTDVLIPCKPTGSPPAVAQWSPSTDPKFLGRYIKTDNGLLIRATDFSDNGNYTCSASNIFGTVNKVFQLTVTEPIKVSVTPSSSQLNSNQSADLICSYTGVPPPIVTWYHVFNNKRVPVTSGLTTGNGQSILHLRNIVATSAGDYTCEVSNAYNKQTSSSNIVVISKPQIIDGPKNQMAKIGSNVILRCNVVANPPATVAWTFPKTGNIPPKTATLHPDGSVSLFHVDAFNEGDYTCTATNAIGSTSQTGSLAVDVPFSVTASPHQQSLKGGESYLQLTCQTSLSGQVAWSKENGPPLSSNRGKYLEVGTGLIITSVDLATDTGVYVCNGTSGVHKGADKVVLYNDLGQLNCSSTFSDCNVGIGGACGGTCPSGCTGGTVYGYLRYTLASQVCTAAIHAGALTNNNQVIWTVNPSTNVFQSILENGIQSQRFGLAIQEARFYNSPGQTIGK